MEKVCAVLVTFNRLGLLKESVAAIFNQSYAVEQLLIVDNCSTDGTPDYLKTLQDDNPRVKVLTTEQNIGGAGGFSLGMDTAMHADKFDFLWIMDDDTIPEVDCLKQLVRPFSEKLMPRDGFTCSNVRWTDGSAALMNIPYVKNHWNTNADLDLVAVKTASFVSLLVSTDAIKKVGLPIKEFFVWGDDYEFTLRISEQAESYCVTDSVVIHKMGVNQGVDIVTDVQERIPRYFYSYRNSIFTELHHGGVRGLLVQILRDIYAVLKVLLHSSSHKWRRIGIIFKGMLSGFFFHPQIHFSGEEVK